MSAGRVLLVVGTRPEAIKMAPVLSALKAAGPRFDAKVCATGQHRHLLDQVFRVFGIEPEFDLDVMRPEQDLTDVTQAVLGGMRGVLRNWRPDVCLVQGDTTSTLGASLAAFYARVPVGHVEAGLRTGDVQAPWPEEMNRRLTGAIATLHFAPTDRARENLLREGVAAGAIHVTGNTVVDALLAMRAHVERDGALRLALEARLPRLEPGRRLVLVTGHRRESFGAGLEAVCRGIAEVVRARDDVEVVYAAHPNPQACDPARRILGEVDRVHVIDAPDYLAFVHLMARSYLIVTDSGGIQEEAPCLGKPVLVTRSRTERMEGVEAGSARLAGTDAGAITAGIVALLDQPALYARMSQARNPYGDGHAARRIADILSRSIP